MDASLRYAEQDLSHHQHGSAKLRLKVLVLGGANAGKTSLLRRYFNGAFHGSRVATLGSDFYTGRIKNPFYEVAQQKQKKEESKLSDKSGILTTKNNVVYKDEQKDHSQQKEQQDEEENEEVVDEVLQQWIEPIVANKFVSIQVWDTPGKERFAANRKAMYTAAFSDSFFRNADAAILVYDITSSTSFTHLLKWHADLMERIRRLEANGERRRPFPVLVVANKIDILKKRDRGEPQRQTAVPQRDVMGLSGRFRGKDSHYEYRASPPSNRPTSSSSSSSSSTRPPKLSDRNRFEISTYMGTGDKTCYLEAVLNNEHRGSYSESLLYLESLLSTEDGSHPDKDMVKIWCLRNGLKHIEVSALDGSGIDSMMEEIVKLALETLNKHSNETAGCSPGLIDALYLHNQELDLLKRYAPEGRPCLSLPPFHMCKF